MPAPEYFRLTGRQSHDTIALVVISDNVITAYIATASVILEYFKIQGENECLIERK